MKIGFLITARLKSSRLKLKIIKPLHGFSVIERVIQRAKKVIECDDIVLCTSSLNQDLPLIRTAIQQNIFYFNGDADDVLKRLLDASLLFNFDYIICMTSDNPLFSIEYANRLSDYIRSNNPSIDFIYTEGMPLGVNVSAINVKALKTVCQVKTELDTEIWGMLVNRPEVFNVKKIQVEDAYCYDKVKRITLDEMPDYELISSIYSNFPQNYTISELEVFNHISKNPELQKINDKVVQIQPSIDVQKRVDKFYAENIEYIKKIKNDIYQGAINENE